MPKTATIVILSSKGSITRRVALSSLPAIKALLASRNRPYMVFED